MGTFKRITNNSPISDEEKISDIESHDICIGLGLSKLEYIGRSSDLISEIKSYVKMFLKLKKTWIILYKSTKTFIKDISKNCNSL